MSQFKIEQSFLEDICSLLKYYKTESLTNTIAKVFNFEAKENFISDWVAFLLDPQQFGDFTPLNVLLLSAGMDITLRKNDNVILQREYVFGNLRRIDFLIETDELIIAIENKIWAGLGENQLEDYANELELLNENNKQIVKILLYPERNRDSSIVDCDSCSNTGFIPITYERFAYELRCANISNSVNARSEFLLKDFLMYVEEYLMERKNKIENNFDLLSFFYNNKETFEKIDDAKKDLHNQFILLIKERIEQKYNGADWVCRNGRSGTYFQVFKSFQPWGDALHFEIEIIDTFPNGFLRVVLHSHEGSVFKDNSINLHNMQDKVQEWMFERYKNNEFEIDYSSLEAFNDSIEKALGAFDAMVQEFAEKIDFIIKNENCLAI